MACPHSCAATATAANEVLLKTSSDKRITLLETEGILESSEIGGAKKVLGAAALTYVASLVAAIVSMLNILRMIIMYRRNRW